MLEVAGVGGRKERKRGTREERKGGSKEKKRKGRTDKGESQGKVLGKVSGGALKGLALSGAPAFLTTWEAPNSPCYPHLFPFSQHILP